MQNPIRITLVALLFASFAMDAQAWGHKKKQVPVPVAPPAPVVLPPPPPPPQFVYSGDQTAPPQPAPVDLLQVASPEVQRVARWVGDTHDNAGMPYLMVDKANAQVIFFDADGHLIATAPVLLGMAKGDRLLVPNNAPMSAMAPTKRITPAGRYKSQLAIDSHHKELLVIDYDAAISMHPVVKGTPAEHRAERLASVTSEDNRVSFGCINVPPAFYAGIISPAFTNKVGLVYILPETKPAAELFGFQAFDAAAPGAQQVLNSPVVSPAQAAPVTGAN